MSMSQPDRISLPRRTFGVDESALDDSETPNEGNAVQRLLRRISTSASQHRPSFVLRWRNDATDADGTEGPSERPPIPTMMQSSGETYSTPLPGLSMVVLSITMLGEFLCANVSIPFMLFMVKGFGEFKDEAEIAFWTGILVSAFFLTQFLTSLLWATVAEKHGRRVVLTISLLGSAITCLIFGTCTTMQQAICVRLMQGVFAGAVGVARGCVAFVTDPSNEGRAYAILGFCWGFGGVAGAIIGGSFERPAVKWPEIFGDWELFVNYPYILPCGLAASITLFGSVLSCFLAPDGGPREGAIKLPPEKLDAHPPIPEEDSVPPSPVFEAHQPTGLSGLKKKISRRFSGYFASRVPDTVGPSTSTTQPPVPLSSSAPRFDRTRTFSRTSRAQGSAYGYAGTYRNRLGSTATTVAPRRGSMASHMRRRRESNLDGTQYGGSEMGDLNFAQRILMANENAVNNIADLWVAAAMNVDNEDPFESDTEADAEDAIEEEVEDQDGDTSPRGRQASRARPTPSSATSPTPGLALPHRPSMTPSGRSPYGRPIPPRHASLSFSQPLDGTPGSRRFSSSVPSIFAHPGVKVPAAVLDAQALLARSEEQGLEPLAPIMESRQSQLEPGVDVEAATEKAPSLASQLPVLIIVQYGLLALHSNMHDQIFMSYLVSDYASGGLNLNAGHFAQLIALMCLAQIVYQFYLYPNLGPPRGRFSHLMMFRLGSLLFIPAYLSVVLYRPFASANDDGNLFLMVALALSTAVRYCGNTFGYTSISILLNYMTPPAAVGYANGIAQSIVSLARCVGPVMGGYLWSVSVQDHPSGYPIGFVVCAALCGLTVLQSLVIR
ncbi:major facilitator superfamily MFS-1 [Pluteus cervinus]|uniref:Major facilitator superfamily MFS-1 n=1 Tax=Pluteus cervinus TaxID=181527 RepID=A0ACD3AQA8_9AGAR|nr:major facilitator superfamily MFS-1 [Pluteus cervinus]